MAAGGDDKGLWKALIAGIFANMMVAIAKLVAFLATGSSAMLAESLHSFADSSNQGLLAFGLKRARKAPTQQHPFGYGKERYFWAFLVSILIFALGAVFAIYEGTHKLLHPEPVKDPTWNFIALGIGFVVEAYALRVAWIEFQHFRRDNPGPLIENLKKTKDPTLPTVLFEDSAALVGLIFAAVGVSAAAITGNPVYDAISSILIGVVLLGVSWFLARESHSLLVGESASTKDREAIRDVVDGDEAVMRLVDLLTLQRSPEDVLVALTVEFRDNLRADDIEKAVVRIEAEIRRRVPLAKYIFVEAGCFATSRIAALEAEPPSQSPES